MVAKVQFRSYKTEMYKGDDLQLNLSFRVKHKLQSTVSNNLHPVS